MKRLLGIILIFIYSYVPIGHTYELNYTTISVLNVNLPLGNYLFIKTSSPSFIGGCQTSQDWNFVLKLDSSLADKIYAGLLAAQLSGARVNLVGSGQCSPWGAEYLSNFTIIKS